MPSPPERHLIKKYANRKLYDTRTSSYITLEGIAGLVRDGHEIKVVDRETGQDLTQVTLSQIVLSDLVNQMEKRRGDLEGVVDEAIERALRRLRIPSHNDIDSINKRLDQLSTQLKRSGVAEPAKGQSRK